MKIEDTAPVCILVRRDILAVWGASHDYRVLARILGSEDVDTEFYPISYSHRDVSFSDNKLGERK